MSVDDLPTPASRKEQYLANIAGMTGVELPQPASRTEEYLYYIAENGGGGGGGGSVQYYTNAELEELWEEA